MSVDEQRLQATALRVWAGISDGPGDGWWFLLVRGLLAVGLGIAALFWPQATLNLLIRLIAVYALVDGVLGLLAALRAREFAAGFAPGLISIHHQVRQNQIEAVLLDLRDCLFAP